MKPSDLILGCLVLASVPALSGQAEWREIPFTEPEAIHGLCARGDTLWAAFDGGVRASADGGENWSESGSGFRPGKVAGVAAGRQRLAACQGNILFLSGDGGRTWSPRDSLEVGEFIRMDSWNDTLFGWHTLFAGSAPGGVRFSTDDGLTWESLAIDRPPLPEPRVFAADTLSFANGTLYRVNSDGPKELYSFAGHIQDVAAAGNRLYALADSIVFTASEPQGPWTPIHASYGPASQILNIASDSDGIAILTPMGLSLSRNRGRDWEFLAANFTYPTWQTLQLSNTSLYVSRWPDDGVPRRYSLTTGEWDSLALPAASPHYRPVFAAAGDRIAWLAQTGSTGDSIFIARGEEGRFRYAGMAPPHPMLNANLFLGRDSVLVFLGQGSLSYSRNDGAKWQPMVAGPCTPTGNPFYAALADSGLFILADNGLLRIHPESGKCDWKRVQVPDGNGGTSANFTVPVSAIAASGGKLYLGLRGKLWVWEESGNVPIRSKPRSFRRASAKDPYPVRVWSRTGEPGSGTSQKAIDARGARRR